MDELGHDTGVVPEGHKVVTFRPAPKPALGRAKSGVWILNFGNGQELTRALDAVDNLVRRGGQQNVIWILQAEFLNALQDLDAFLARVAAIIANSRGTVEHCAVFATDASKRTDIMQALKKLGLGVHYSAPDGTCLVEVHRPDGIVVGMPGPAFDSGAA